jgi:hypothetical protein
MTDRRQSAEQLSRLVVWCGWIVAASCAHFGIEVCRTVNEMSPHGSGGIADLSRITSLTGVVYWLAPVWIAGAAVVLIVRIYRLRRVGALSLSTVGHRWFWILVIVGATYCFATWTLTLARGAEIKLVY